MKRGNSVYLVDRVLPMLPKLSNGLCSLNPNRDRLALSVRLDFDARGRRVDGDVLETVIRSDVRSTYTEIKRIMDGGDPDDGRPCWFKEHVQTMIELARCLDKQRAERGALDFDFPETCIDLDSEGHPTAIYPYPTSFANRLIELFMVAANEYIAELAERHSLPILYRVHDLPDPVKLERFAHLARRLGLKIKWKGEPEPADLADALESVQAKPYGLTLSHLLLRALAKAEYSAINRGHFGLALRDYCHFTSPIRRYSDLFTHRTIKQWLKRQDMARKRLFAQAERVALHVSETERTAMAAERDTVDQKAAEYYAERIAEVYEGVISGMTHSAAFVMLPDTVEGLCFTMGWMATCVR